MSYKKKCFQVVLSLLLLSQSICLFPSPVMANDGDVKIAGQPIFSVSGAGSAGSITQRTEIIQNNLDNALVAAQDRTPGSVNITYVQGMPVITLGGYQVATISAQDAAAAHTTPALLASQWADKIRNALTNQASVSTYVAQLSGGYSASAPPATAPIPTNTLPTNTPLTTNTPPAISPGNAGPNSAAAWGSGTNAQPSAQAPFQAPGSTIPYTNVPPTNYSSASPGPYAQGGQANSSPGYDSYNNNPTNASPGYAGTAGGAAAGAAAGSYGQQPYANSPPGQGYRQGRVIYAPAGQIIPITLTTSIATQVAKAGDLIQGNVSQNINVGESVIPAGSTVIGQVASAEAGRRLTRSGELQIKFTTLRLPDGSEAPITAHIVGGIGKYAKGKQPDQVEGETWKNKVGSVAFRGLLGAGGGAALGTAVGAIAGGGHGAGMGAWSGAAIGTGVGAADSLLLRKGADVTVPSGTNIQLQLDSPVTISGGAPANYNQGGYNPPPGGYGSSYSEGTGARFTNGGNPGYQPSGNSGYNPNQYNAPPIR